MSNLTKKRVHWFEKDNGKVTHDEDVDVLTSADAVTFDDGDTLQRKYDDKVLARTSDVGNLKGLSTTNKSSLVDAVNEVVTSDASNKSSIEKHVANKLNPHGVTKSQVGLGNADNTSDVNKPVSTAQQNAINSALSTAKEYADTKVANLVGAAPETLDTLEEVAQALAENDDVVEALNNAIGTKANQSDFNSHISNKNNPHGVTAEQTPYDKNTSGLNASNVQGAIDELKGTIGNTRKNLLKNTGTTTTINGVTFTVNSDKSVTVSGKSTAVTHFSVGSITFNGNYKLNGCLDGAVGKYCMYLINPYTACFDKDVEFKVTETVTSNVIIYVASGVSVNTTFYPMIRYASITDDTYEPYVEDIDTRIDNAQSDVDLLNNTIGYTKKNLLKLAGNIGDTLTYVGVTVKKTGNNTYTLSGTSTQDTWFEIGYCFSIGTTQQTNNYLELNVNKTYCTSVRVEGTINAPSKNPSIAFQGTSSVSTVNLIDTLNSSTLNNTSGLKRVWISIPNATTLNNVTLKLQLEEGTNATDFEDYVEDVDTRINNAQGDVDLLKGTIGYSKKNLIPYPFKYSTGTGLGITWNDNGDGTMLANGKSTAVTSFEVMSRTNSTLLLKAGTYIVNGCPQGGSESTYRIVVSRTNNGVSEIIASDEGNGATFTLKENTLIGVYIDVLATGVNLNNLTFKPMIRYASITDDTYEPYVEDVQTQLNNIGIQLGNAKCINLMDTSTPGSPWLALKSQIASLPNDCVVFGYINTGPLACYIGYKRAENTYGSFMVLQYLEAYHVALSNGKWYVKKINDAGTEF